MHLEDAGLYFRAVCVFLGFLWAIRVVLRRVIRGRRLTTLQALQTKLDLEVDKSLSIASRGSIIRSLILLGMTTLLVITTSLYLIGLDSYVLSSSPITGVLFLAGIIGISASEEFTDNALSDLAEKISLQQGNQ